MVSRNELLQVLEFAGVREIEVDSGVEDIFGDTRNFNVGGLNEIEISTFRNELRRQIPDRGSVFARPSRIDRESALEIARAVALRLDALPDKQKSPALRAMLKDCPCLKPLPRP